MPSIYDLLIGKSEADYYSEDPFYQGGASFLRGPMAQPRTNAEAIWMPALQGLLGGAALGYGKRQAKDAAYEDFRTNPLLAALSGESAMSLPEQRPDDWKITDGRQSLILAALQKQNADELKLKEAAAKFELEKLLAGKGMAATPNGIAAIPGFAETAAEIAGKEAGAKRAAENSASTVIQGVPATLQDEALKEKQNLANRAKANDFIDAQFDVAASLPSIKAALPGTDAANEMTGVAQGLRTYIQKYLGREMNGPEQEKFLTLLPDWNDTQKQIELKRDRFKQLMDSLTDATPVLDTFRSGGAPVADTATAPAAQVPPGMKLQKNMKTGETRLVPIGDTLRG